MQEDYRAVSRDLENIWCRLEPAIRVSVAPYFNNEPCDAALFHVGRYWFVILRDDVVMKEWNGDPVYSFVRLPDRFPDIGIEAFCAMLNRAVPPVLSHGDRSIAASEIRPMLQWAKKHGKPLYRISEEGLLEDTATVVRRIANILVDKGSSTLILEQSYQWKQPVGAPVLTLYDSVCSAHGDWDFSTDVALPAGFPFVDAEQFCKALNALPLHALVRSNRLNRNRNIELKAVVSLLETAKHFTVHPEREDPRYGESFALLLKRYIQ